jgi:RES domain-containing protein
MILYRLTKKKYQNDLSGIGSEIAGGRWNYKGTRLVYTSESRALCTAEIAVHTPFGVVPDDYYLMTINIPNGIKIETIDVDNLPSDWKKFPNIRITQDLGEEFIKKGKSLVLKVPSAVVQGDFNYLINPNHKEIDRVKIIDKEKFDFDERLFK